MAYVSTQQARERCAQFLQWNLVEGITQKEIAKRAGITQVRVNQIIKRGYNEVINGRIRMPADFDYTKAKGLVDDMLWYSCHHTCSSFNEAKELHKTISQLTINEQLYWIRKLGQIRWYQL